MAYSSGIKYLLRESILWIAVAVLSFSGVYYFDDLRAFAGKTIAAVVSKTVIVADEVATKPRKSQPKYERSVTLTAGRNGHFFARAYINGQPIAVMVDTGATKIALTYKDAESLGLRPNSLDFTMTSRTANGTARMAPIELDSVRIGDVEVSDLRGSIAQEGKLHITLLGMEFIRKLERFEMRGRELMLVE